MAFDYSSENLESGKRMTSFGIKGVGCILLCLAACRTGTLEPKVRPASVPNYAIWVGGADGGAYVFCTVNRQRNVNTCKVWNDFTGQLIEHGDYRLVRENRAANETELKISFPDLGGKIYLANGLVLQRQ